jgi:hypothetical protein
MIDIETFEDIFLNLKNSYNITNLKDLSAKTGNNYTYLSELNSGRKPLTVDFVRKINEVFNTDFVIRPINDTNVMSIEGFLEYFNLSKNELCELIGVSLNIFDDTINKEKKIYKNWNNIIFDKYKTRLKIDNETKFPIKKEAAKVSSDNFMEVSLMSINAQAGYLNSIIEKDADYMNELDTILVPKEYEKGYYLVVEVNGDSMDDGTSRSVCNGDKLLCQELQKIHWVNKLHFRQYIFIIVSNEGIVCKQIISQDVANGTIVCHSWNPMFKDYTINLNDVYQIFYVKKVVERRIKF